MAAWTRKTQAVIVGAVAAAVAVSGTGAALAAGGRTSGSAAPKATTHARLLTLQHRADRRFTAAERRLGALQQRVDQAKPLAADRSMLDAEISTLAGKVKAAAQQVDAATTLAQARKDLRADRSLLVQGRVIIRQVQQLRVAEAAELATAKSAARLKTVATTVNATPPASPARAALTDLQARLADANHQAESIIAADRSLSVTTPDTAKKVLTRSQTALNALRVDQRKAAADRQQIRKSLRAAKKSAATTQAG